MRDKQGLLIQSAGSAAKVDLIIPIINLFLCCTAIGHYNIDIGKLIRSISSVLNKLPVKVSDLKYAIIHLQC